MSHRTIFTAVAAAVLAATVPTRAPGQGINGRVEEVRAHDVHVCFYGRAAPPAGLDLTVLRRIVVAATKNDAPIRMQAVAAIRITMPADGNCADATLVSGDARSSDWVVASR